jgi:hypothetical protein
MPIPTHHFGRLPGRLIRHHKSSHFAGTTRRKAYCERRDEMVGLGLSTVPRVPHRLTCVNPNY